MESIKRWKCLGSGDPPGLQNRRSSLTGDGVFDSHALPPAHTRHFKALSGLCAFEGSASSMDRRSYAINDFGVGGAYKLFVLLASPTGFEPVLSP
jgi:hypothetical protein